VSNMGTRDGSEVVQFYVRDLVGSRTRPVKQLVGFEKVHIQPGTSAEVTLELKASDLAFYTADGKWEAEPGDFVLFVGRSSEDVQQVPFSLR